MLGFEMVADFDEAIADIESTVGLVSNSNFVEPMSTSSLALDLLCFGRIRRDILFISLKRLAQFQAICLA